MSVDQIVTWAVRGDQQLTTMCPDAEDLLKAYCSFASFGAREVRKGNPEHSCHIRAVQCGFHVYASIYICNCLRSAIGHMAAGA